MGFQVYDRDYSRLTAEEQAEIAKIDKEKTPDNELPVEAFLKYPTAYFINKSLFPNNMLDIGELKKSCHTEGLMDAFFALTEKALTTERDLLNFIKDNRAYFIIASLFDRFEFGHHIAFIFPEFPLGTNYKVDYLLVGKNSGGFEFIFVELENVDGNIVNKDDSLGLIYRKGMEQLEKWQGWVDENFNSLRPIFEKFQNMAEPLPKEFYTYDSTRMHFVVIAGKRRHYTSETYRRRRRRGPDIRMYHYDNLIDFAINVVRNGNY